MKEPLTPTKELLKKRLFLTLPIAPSVNHCYVNTKWGNKKILNKKAKEWFKEAKNIILGEVLRQKWIYTQQVKIVCEITTYWASKRTRDTHNLYKVLCDVFEDIVIDNDCYLLMRQIDWGIDKENPRLEIVMRAFNPETDKWQYDKFFKKKG